MCFSLVISLLTMGCVTFYFLFLSSSFFYFILFYLIARSLSLIFPSVSPSSSTLVCFFAVLVSIATSLCFLPRSSEPSPVTDFSSSPFLSIRLNIFHPFYTSLSFDSGYLAPPFLIDFNLNAFWISSSFSSFFFFISFAFLSLNFLRRVPFSCLALSLRISPFDSYFPASFLPAFITNEIQHGFKTSYFLSRIFSYHRPYSRAFTLLNPS